MNSRERFNATMHYQSVDRGPFYEWLGCLVETINKWHGEGLPYGISVRDYFDFDKKEQVSIDLGPIPRFIPKIISEDVRYRISRGDTGITVKNLRGSLSMPSFIDFPVKTRNDWEQMKKRLDPSDKRRYPKT